MILSSSFRDPSGFLFLRDGNLYRQINKGYEKNFNLFTTSGLKERLSLKPFIIPYEVVDIPPEDPDNIYKIIRPLRIPFISYPYEWSFSQLKQAALLTLEIQKISLEYGMSLKDASGYNVQFHKGKPVFIDTLSFEQYEPGKPWIAYRQFCRHFLAPLALMEYSDISLGQLLRTNIDGIPLGLTSTLLPKKTWLNFGLLMHIHLHAKSEKKYADVHAPLKPKGVSISALLGMLDNLTSTIEKMQWEPSGTEWAAYYQDTNYSAEAFGHKKELVAGYLEMLNPESVWDLGANNGFFSRFASDKGIFTLAFDVDPACVELNYREIVQKHEQNLLPLLIDLTNPSPGIGWKNTERYSLIERGPADTVLALALIHHLAISNNIPMIRIAEFLSNVCCSLIIEFIPKTDSQVQKLLANREDIFGKYDVDHFEESFSVFFNILQKEKIKTSDRILYLMKKR